MTPTNLIARVRGWFRREPREISPFHHNCGLCGYISPAYPKQSMAIMDVGFHKCNPPTLASSYVVIPKGIVVTAVAPTLDQLRLDFEQAKAAYEAALVEQLAGLKDEQ